MFFIWFIVFHLFSSFVGFLFYTFSFHFFFLNIITLQFFDYWRKKSCFHRYTWSFIQSFIWIWLKANIFNRNLFFFVFGSHAFSQWIIIQTYKFIVFHVPNWISWDREKKNYVFIINNLDHLLGENLLSLLLPF